MRAFMMGMAVGLAAAVGFAGVAAAQAAAAYRQQPWARVGAEATRPPPRPARAALPALHDGENRASRAVFVVERDGRRPIASADPSHGAGAKGMRKCKTEGDACFQNKNCVQLFNRIYFGSVDKDGNPIGGCARQRRGACYTFVC